MCKQVDAITLKHNYTHEQMDLHSIESEGVTSTKPMSEVELIRMHGLRKNDKGLKPGASKKKPNNVFDIGLVPGEPIDFEELEVQ